MEDINADKIRPVPKIILIKNVLRPVEDENHDEDGEEPGEGDEERLIPVAGEDRHRGARRKTKKKKNSSHRKVERSRARNVNGSEGSSNQVEVEEVSPDGDEGFGEHIRVESDKENINRNEPQQDDDDENRLAPGGQEEERGAIGGVAIEDESGDEDRIKQGSHNEVVEELHKYVPAHALARRCGKVTGMLQRGTPNTIDLLYESLDYEQTCCKLRLSEEGSGPTFWQRVVRWPNMAVIGFLTGTTAFVIFVSIDFLSEVKYRLITKVFRKISDDKSDDNHFWLLTQGMVVSTGLNLVACGVSALIGITMPVCCGSGIPHIKAYLNGVNIPKLLRFRTYLHKVAGVIFSVVGGLPVGKEGPMIHAGAIHGGGISQGMSTSMSFRTRLFENFRNDATKRDFVAGGAAAGVSAAFGAPLGGVLFAIEEGCSFIDVPTIFQILVGTASSYFTLNFFKSIYLGTSGELSNGGLINFGSFHNATYNTVDLLIFLVIGVIGGLLGALWNTLNARLTRIRMRLLLGKVSKFFEVLVVSAIVTGVAFVCMTSVKDCKYIDNDVHYNKNIVEMNCEEGKYHAGAALWFETPENSVKDMLHSELHSFNALSLSAFFVWYFVLSCLTYGLNISSGLFIPSLLIGAAWGRLLGLCLITSCPWHNFGDVGKFSLMGASAQLSGIVRLTISLCVILVEATGGMTYAFPILIVVIVAKVVGDMFNHGIYDIHLDLSGVPILEWKPPINAHTLSAKDVMASPVFCLNMRSKMTEIHKAMQETNHSAFPIVDRVAHDQVGTRQPPGAGKLRGLILRTDIITMVFNELYDQGARGEETWQLFRDMYPRYIPTDSLVYNLPHQRGLYLDFRNIVNPAPQTCQSALGFDRVFSQFRTTGARHIIVVNDCNEVIGMITRKDLNRPVPTGGHCVGHGPLKAKTMIVPCVESEAYKQMKLSVA